MQISLWSKSFQVLRENFLETIIQYKFNYKPGVAAKGRYFHTKMDETRYSGISILFVSMYVTTRKTKNFSSWKCIILRSEYGHKNVWVRRQFYCMPFCTLILFYHFRLFIFICFIKIENVFKASSQFLV